jgi:hypothetical protein
VLTVPLPEILGRFKVRCVSCAAQSVSLSLLGALEETEATPYCASFSACVAASRNRIFKKRKKNAQHTRRERDKKTKGSTPHAAQHTPTSYT